jgi:hypothetical protein
MNKGCVSVPPLSLLVSYSPAHSDYFDAGTRPSQGSYWTDQKLTQNTDVSVSMASNKMPSSIAVITEDLYGNLTPTLIIKL